MAEESSEKYSCMPKSSKPLSDSESCNMIFTLFGRSPFKPIQQHMQQVFLCVSLLRDLFEILEKNSCFPNGQPSPQLKKAIQAIKEREHLADLTKNDLRRRLEKMLFLPFDRTYLLEILALQDLIADNCEKIAQRTELIPLPILPQWKKQFFALLDQEIKHVESALVVIDEIDALAKSSFGGREAAHLEALIEEIAIGHARCRESEQVFLRELFQHAEQMPYPAFLVWERVIERLGKISFYTEKALYRLKRVLFHLRGFQPRRIES